MEETGKRCRSHRKQVLVPYEESRSEILSQTFRASRYLASHVFVCLQYLSSSANLSNVICVITVDHIHLCIFTLVELLEEKNQFIVEKYMLKNNIV